VQAQDAALFTAAERILSEAVGQPLQFDSIERLTGPDGSKTLYRCRAAFGPGTTGAFVIKKGPPRPAVPDSAVGGGHGGFCHDWAGAEFLSSLAGRPPISPRYYGGDLYHGFFVLEDLGEHRSLVEPLLGSDAASAEAGLMKYGACLGSLHAATAGSAGAFEALFAARFPRQPPFVEEVDGLEARLSDVQSLLDALGVPTAPELAAEMQRVGEAGSRPGPFLAYLHGDPCPDNLFDLGDHYRLIDFEWGHFGHALLDAVYPRMIWPSCWCAHRLPEATLGRMENRYRMELVQGCPVAQDDAAWETAMVDMCALTLINRLGWDLPGALKADRQRGRATVRQRTLAQLEAFVQTTETFRRRPALRAAASRLRDVLRACWADTPPLGTYPALGGEPA
jgi:hypothetical protein